MNSWNRRGVVKLGAGLTLSSLVRSGPARAADAPPHFFLQILLQNGVDSMYLLDARPLSFVAANRAANYAGVDPTVWEGAAGGRTLAAPAAEVLKPLKSRIAVVNGIHMPPGFDGHEQNGNSMLTGNPFGGAYFGAFVTKPERSLSYLTLDTLIGVNLTNQTGVLSMPSAVAPSLASQAAGLGGGSGSGSSPSSATEWSRKSAETCGGGAGVLADGCRAMRAGLDNAAGLAARLSTLPPPFADGDAKLLKAVKVAAGYFKAGIADTCLVALEESGFDTHSETDAAKAPELHATLAADIATVLTFLAATPFDEAAGISMLDVTTVLMTPEFSRTHGQTGKPMTATGTDHNPLGNYAILAGRGIKGDIVVGATDLDELTAGNAFANVSDAHKALDKECLKRMGKPYDFTTGEVAAQLPSEYKLADYISAASVINTVLDAFDVPKAQWLNNDPQLQGGVKVPAKTLAKIRI